MQTLSINNTNENNEDIKKITTEIIEKLNDESFDLLWSIKGLIRGEILDDLSKISGKLTDAEMYQIINEKNEELGDSILHIALKKYYDQLTGDFVVDKLEKGWEYSENIDTKYLASVKIEGGNKIDQLKNKKEQNINELDIDALQLSETSDSYVVIERLYHQVMKAHGINIYEGKQLLSIDSTSPSGFLVPILILKKLNPELLKKITEILKDNLYNFENIFGNYNGKYLVGFVKFYEEYPNIIKELKNNPFIYKIFGKQTEGSIKLNENLISIYNEYKGLFDILKDEHSFYFLIENDITYNNLIKLNNISPDIIKYLKRGTKLSDILSDDICYDYLLQYINKDINEFLNIIQNNPNIINIFGNRIFHGDKQEEKEEKIETMKNGIALLNDLETNHKGLYDELKKSPNINYIVSSNDIYVKFLKFNDKESELSKIIYTNAPADYFRYILNPSNKYNKEKILPNLKKVYSENKQILNEVIQSGYSADVFSNDQHTELLIEIYYNNKSLFNLIKDGFALSYFSKTMVEKYNQYPEKMKILLKKPEWCNFGHLLDNDIIFLLSNQELEKLDDLEKIDDYYNKKQRQIKGRKMLVEVGRKVEKEKKDISGNVINLLDNGIVPKKYQNIIGKNTDLEKPVCDGANKTGKEVALQLYFSTLSPKLKGNQLDLNIIDTNKNGINILKDIKIFALKKLNYYDDFKEIENFNDIINDDKKFKNLLYLGEFKITFNENGYNSKGEHEYKNNFKYFIKELNFNFLLNKKKYIKYFIELKKEPSGGYICEILSKNPNVIDIIEAFSTEELIKYKELLRYKSLSVVTVSQLKNRLEEANYNNITL